ncbi:MAG: dephospho-CoA kinase [Bryobacterales bacterium]|nr:dephospho-CoA kinase [Bryobacterales bacterium]
MLRAGLTGGLATGKSFVGRALAELGCYLIKADDIGREVMAPGGEAFDAIVREFGEEMLAVDGSIDRQRLAGRVFADPERLEALNRIVHPPVIRREDRLTEEIGARDRHAIVVCEAAVMIEAGSHRRMDKLILTVCREEQQVERAVARGLSAGEALLRIRRQMPLEEKRRYADYIIDTSGAEAETLLQVQEVYNLLRGLA